MAGQHLEAIDSTVQKTHEWHEWLDAIAKLRISAMRVARLST